MEKENCEVPIIEEEEEEVKHVNPYEVPYIPSSHVQKLMARKKARDERLKIEQKKT
jgi:hypothetical protein